MRLRQVFAVIHGASLALMAAWRLPAQAFVDRSPHRSARITHSAARIHFLEWSTRGPAVVLLPGYSLTAHAFDDLAPLLSTKFRVIAVTPRGFGESDAPAQSAYTISTLVEDLHALLDSLHIAKAALIGHSLSGSVIATFALQYPERVTRLVFLDAFPYFMEEHGDSIAALDPITTPSFSGDTTYDAVARYLRIFRYVPWHAAFDADLRAKPLGAEGARRRALTVAFIADQWAHAPDLAALRLPALQVCAVASVTSEYPWLRASDSAYQFAKRYIGTQLQSFNRRLCRRFETSVPEARIAQMHGSHYVFFTNPSETARVLTQFLRADLPH